MREFKWWVEDGGHMNGITHQQQVEAMELGWRELESVCNIKFTRVSRRNQSRIAVTFVDSDNVGGALGRAGTHGRIRINRERDLRLNGVWRPGDDYIRNRYVTSLMQHEAMHVFGFGHDDRERWCMMHSHLGYWLCPPSALLLQRKYGQPENVFYPVRRQHLGVRVRNLVTKQTDLRVERERLIEQRSTLPTKPLRQEAHAKVLVNLQEIVDTHQRLSTESREWHKVNREWQNVPKVG